MQLVYVNGTFIKYVEGKNAAAPSSGALRALFYDKEKKEWMSPHQLDERSKLDYAKNQMEFHERKWILLKKNAETQEFYHDGPYSSFEIYEMLTQSAVRLTDPIWKEGMTKWMPIKNTQTFKALATLSEPMETDIADLLGSVVEYDPEMHRVEEKKLSPGSPDEVFLILDDK